MRPLRIPLEPSHLNTTSPSKHRVGGGACDQCDLWAGSGGISAPSGFWLRPSPLPCPVASSPAATRGESPEGRRAIGGSWALGFPKLGLAVLRQHRERRRCSWFRFPPPSIFLGRQRVGVASRGPWGAVRGLDGQRDPFSPGQGRGRRCRRPGGTLRGQQGSRGRD